MLLFPNGGDDSVRVVVDVARAADGGRGAPATRQGAGRQGRRRGRGGGRGRGAAGGPGRGHADAARVDPAAAGGSGRRRLHPDAARSGPHGARAGHAVARVRRAALRVRLRRGAGVPRAGHPLQGAHVRRAGPPVPGRPAHV